MWCKSEKSLDISNRLISSYRRFFYLTNTLSKITEKPLKNDSRGIERVYMKGNYGTSMQSIEYRNRKGNRKCSQCEHLRYKVMGKSAGYFCEVKNQKRYYTALCYCKQYEQKSH